MKLVEEKKQKEPEVIVVQPEKPQTTEVATQMEPPTEEWVLEAEVTQVEEHVVEDDAPAKGMDVADPLVFSRQPWNRPQAPKPKQQVELYKPQKRPSIEPKIIKIQRWFRRQMFRAKLRILFMTKTGENSKQLVHSHMRRIETKNFGEKYYSISLWKYVTKQPCQVVATGDGGFAYVDEKAANVSYVLEAKEYTQADDSLGARKQDSFITVYDELRLPDNIAVLKYYLISGTIVNVDETTGLIDALKLVRLQVKLKWALPMVKNSYQLPLQVPIDKIGCNLKLQFLLRKYPNHLCKVYKRLRYQDPEKREGLVKDWKIKVV